MKINKLGVGLALVGVLLGANYVHDQCFVAVEKRETFYSDKLKNDIKISHISDFHSNAIKNLDELLGKIDDFSPHIIVLTGDIIDAPTDKKIQRSAYFLKRLTDLGYPTYFVSGNHEEAFTESEIFYKIVDKLGIKRLENEGDLITIGESDLYIYGINYFKPSFENFSPKEESFNLVLSHFSKNVRDDYDEDFDLILSGHTHGGQVRAPFVGALLAPGEGYFPDYDMGKFTYEDSTIYIESGLGNTFLPLRFLNPISYTNITISPDVGP